MSPTAVTLTCVLVTMTCMIQTSETRTVVSIPYPFTSHAKYHTNVARVLAKRGHHVWVALPTYILDKEYLDTSGFIPIPYDTIPHLEQTLQSTLSDSYFESNQDQLFEFLKVCRRMFDLLLRNDSFIRTVKDINPDLIVIDNLPTFYAACIIPYRLGIPFAFLGSAYHAPMLQVPFSPADVPMVMLPYSNKMNFLQRLHNVFFYLLLEMYNPSFPDDAMSTYAPEMKYLSLKALMQKAEVFLVELDNVLDYPKPTLPNIKLIGGTATGPAKALAPEFQSFMDSAQEGVVIVSFGSYVLNLPQHISDKVLQVLLQLPMKSVFRSNLTSPDPKKILTSQWIPQNDLLGHPHTKVFVSHCGKNGQYEALYHAVPVVAFPLFLDQPYNAERVRVKGFAEVLDLNTCTAEEMKSAILKVTSEPRYKQAVVKYSRLYKEVYGVPMETAAYWLDHVMEYGGDYMRSAGQQMPLYQYVLLDVFLFILCVLALTIGLLCVVIRAVCKYCCQRKAKAD
ncbi:hypothetical protein ACOMHN_049663 [Nucella lapillus]